jgi:hypothetical protein
MQWAIDENGCRVYASKNTDRNKKWYCPICRGEVRLRAGSINVPHFAHIDSCTDDWNYEPMSEWHIAWQNLFPKGNREVVVTHPETGEKHRADVGVYGTVIEFQHSPISESEFWRRNNFYTSVGYKVVWIFDMIDLSDGLLNEDERLCCIDDWDKPWGSGGKFRWKNPWRFLGGFLPQDEKEIDIFFSLAPLGENPKDREASYLERVTWVNPDFSPLWGWFYTSYNILNYSDLMDWLKKRYYSKR